MLHIGRETARLLFYSGPDVLKIRMGRKAKNCTVIVPQQVFDRVYRRLQAPYAGQQFEVNRPCGSKLANVYRLLRSMRTKPRSAENASKLLRSSRYFLWVAKAAVSESSSRNGLQACWMVVRRLPSSLGGSGDGSGSLRSQFSGDFPSLCDDLGFIPFVGAGVLARELATDGSTGMDGTPAMLDAATGFLKFAGSMVFWMTGLTLGSVSAVQLQRPLFFPVDYAIT